MISYIFFLVLLTVALLCAIGISRADFRRRIIPDAYLFPLMLIGFLLSAAYPTWGTDAYSAAIGGVVGYIMAAGIGYIFARHQSRRHPGTTITPIGMGDIKLISVAGIWIGIMGLSMALILACGAGCIWAMRNKQKYIPFGPFLVGGGILTLIARTFLL